MRPLPLAALAAASFVLTAGPCRADQKALALLNKVETATRTAGTLSAKFTYTVTTAAGETRDEGTVRLMKPNYARIAYRPAGMNYSRLIVSDGKTLWQVTLPDNKVTQEATDPKGQNIRVFGSLLIQAFFSAFTAVKQNIDGSDALDGVKCGATVTVDGAPYETLVSHQDSETDTLFVGPDHIIRRYVSEFQSDGKPGRMEATLSDVQAGTPMSTLDFLYTPPPPRPAQAPAPPLLANGTNAPGFTLPGRDGAPISLSDSRGKVVLLVFWTSWWAPSQRSLTSVNDVAGRYAAQGLTALAVNVWDAPGKAAEFLAKHPELDKLTFAFDARAKQIDLASVDYHVTGLPTEYLIGKDGRIVANFHDAHLAADTLENAVKAVVGP